MVKPITICDRRYHTAENGNTKNLPRSIADADAPSKRPRQGAVRAASPAICLVNRWYAYLKPLISLGLTGLESAPGMQWGCGLFELCYRGIQFRGGHVRAALSSKALILFAKILH